MVSCWPVPNSEGRLPSATLSTKTLSHSWPLALWIVLRMRKSSSSSGSPASSPVAAGGSSASSVKKLPRSLKRRLICSSWARSAVRTSAASYRNGNRGSYHCRATWICSLQSQLGSDNRPSSSPSARQQSRSAARALGLNRASSARSWLCAVSHCIAASAALGPSPGTNWQQRNAAI